MEASCWQGYNVDLRKQRWDVGGGVTERCSVQAQIDQSGGLGGP